MAQKKSSPLEIPYHILNIPFGGQSPDLGEQVVAVATADLLETDVAQLFFP